MYQEYQNGAKHQLLPSKEAAINLMHLPQMLLEPGQMLEKLGMGVGKQSNEPVFGVIVVW